MQPEGDSEQQQRAFQQLARERQRGVVFELFDFLRNNKKWWLTPIIVMLLLLGLVLVLSSSPAAPFIYTLF
jgi:hypothetical protein